MVYNLALSFLQNTEDAEDITQEVFIEVYNSFYKFKGNSTIST
jgi:RNA polymerase sigma-70 factor (ECF subfamily)